MGSLLEAVLVTVVVESSKVLVEKIKEELGD